MCLIDAVMKYHVPIASKKKHAKTVSNVVQSIQFTLFVVVFLVYVDLGLAVASTCG